MSAPAAPGPAPAPSPAPCPSEDLLEAAAVGATDNPRVTEHLAACDACRGRVEEIRENNRFLVRVRSGEQPLTRPDAGADLIPGYVILGEIHRGGQGVVYKAVQGETRRKVAIKVLLHGHLTSTRQRLRFEQEIALAASLRHPNIVLVFDSVRPRDGRLGYAMEYVRGRPLDDWASGVGGASAPGIEEKVRLFIKVCSAVQYAHRRGIIHRDLKPGNILVDADGEPRLCDFGVAKIIAGDAPPTVTGEFVGTLAYASPEQVTLSPDQIDTRSDCYTLGVLLYEVLTGSLPYPVDGPMQEIIRNITTAVPRRPAEAGVRLRTDLETIVMRALAKEPDRRYQSAQALADDLRRYLSGEAIEARRSSGWYVLRKSARRHWPALAVGAAFVLLVAGFGVISRVQASRLAAHLSLSRVERARGLVELGNVGEAEGLLWGELLAGPRGVAAWDPASSGLPASRAWWALWELYAEHPCRRSVRVGRGPVNLLASPPGRPDRLLTADGTGRLTLWSWPALEPVASAIVTEGARPGAEHWPGTRLVEFTPDGAIVTMDRRNVVKRWDARSLAPAGEPFEVECHANFGARLSDGGRWLLAGDAQRVRVHEGATGALLEEFPNPAGTVNFRGCFLPGGPTIVHGEPGGLVVRPLLGTGAPARVPFARGDKADGFTVAADGRVLLSASMEVFAFDPRSLRLDPVGVLEQQARAGPLAASPDARRCAVVSEDRRISIWDVPAGGPASPPPHAAGAGGPVALAYYSGHNEAVVRLAFTPAGQTLISADFDGVLKEWDLPRADRERGFRRLAGHEGTVFGAAAFPDGARACSGGVDGVVRLWDLDGGQAVGASEPLGGSVEAVAVPPDGGWVLAAVDRGQRADLVALEAPGLRVTRTLEGAHEVRCPDLAFGPGGALVATAGDDGAVRVWDARTFERLAEQRVDLPGAREGTPGQVRSIRFSPDGRRLAWGGFNGLVAVADAGLGRPARALSGPRATVRCVRFSADGRRLAAAGDDFAVFVWEAASGRLVREMRGHSGYVYGMDFSRDGRFLATCGGDGTVRLWDAQSGANLAILRGPGGREAVGLFTLAFSPSGDRLVTGGIDGRLGAWDLRAFEPHIAGNLGLWLGALGAQGRSSPIARAAGAWAERVRSGRGQE